MTEQQKHPCRIDLNDNNFINDSFKKKKKIDYIIQINVKIFSTN